MTEFPVCCKDTIRKHVDFNPMMACPECRSLIKAFKDKKSFENYIKFCHSRKREILQDEVDGNFVVSYKTFERMH